VLETLRVPGASTLASPVFPPASLFAPIVEGTRLTTALFPIALLALLVWLLLQRMPLGYALRMIGINSRFARYGGIANRRTMMLGMALSGGLGGLAGVYLALAIHERLPQTVSSNLTFEGVVVTLLARNNPLCVPAMALLYAYLRAGAPIMQNDAGVSREIVRVIQAVIILLFTAEGLLSFWRARRKVAA
jgi:general nucleoside transport system permease protein